VLTGPKRSALQAMLANLGNEDDHMHAGAASSGQSRSSSSSASSGNSMPEIDELGMQDEMNKTWLLHIFIFTYRKKFYIRNKGTSI
jgi:hypothetical protein